jgi:circadian clock protein KaiC
MKKAHSKKKVIKKKSNKEKRLPTGIPNLDQMMGGGFEDNSTNLVMGTSGSGKSIFATQFLMEGIKKGEKGLYVTFEETKSEFYHNMKKFGWNLEDYEKKGMFSLLEYTPEKVKTMLDEGGGAIENIIVKNKVKRIVIDSITSFVLLFNNELEKREASLALFNMIGKWSCTSVLTYEGGKDEKADTRALEFESDSVISLYFLRNKSERKHYLEILKMRGTKHSNKIYSFSISQKGISLDKKPYVGELDLN